MGRRSGSSRRRRRATPSPASRCRRRNTRPGCRTRLPAPFRPLPFLYQSTGVETRFTNRFDPEPRSGGCSTSTSRGRSAEWLAESRSWLPTVDGQPDPRCERPLDACGRASGDAVRRGEGPLARAAEGRQESGGSLAPGPAPRPDPDGDRQRQDLHRRHRRLPDGEVRRTRSACCSWWIGPTSGGRR